MHITSVHNPRLRAAVKLRDRKERAREGRFLIDGRREILLAIGAGVTIEEAFVNATDNGAGEEELDSLVELLRQSGAQILRTAPAPFGKIAFGERDEGIVAVAKTPATELSTLELPPDPLVVVLEGVEKPGNVGAVLRTADAVGAAAVIVADGGTDLFNPNAIRASLGAIFTVPVRAASSSQTLAWLQEQGLAIYGARVDGAADYSTVSYRGPTAIVLGSEASGLSMVWSGAHVQPISLPMLGTVDSLNVSVTAAVVLYEALRQRTIGSRRA